MKVGIYGLNICNNMNNEKLYYGFYRGVVIQNNDPDRAGKIKVFIPQFAAHFARNAGVTEDELRLSFVGGKNIDTFLKGEVLKKFRNSINWIEQASPLVGSGTAGVYDAKNDIATVSDAHRGEEFLESSSESITKSGEPVSPKALHSIHGIKGNFDIGSNTGTCDPRNDLMSPSGINNAAKGLFSIPRVGAWVWLFFENGSLDKPVYFGYSYGKEDWNSVLNPQESNANIHYPAGAENIEDGEPFFYTGQTVFNSKAGSLEFTDTDDFENIRLSHFGGSFFAIGNDFWYDTCVGNKTYVVNKDEFHTVKGNRSLFVEGESHEHYRDYHYTTYGDLNSKSTYEQWMETAAPAFQHAALFAEKEREVKDPTTNGETTKKGPNDKYKSPDKLTLGITSGWNTLLKQVNPFEYSGLDQLEVLKVTKV